MDCVAVRQYLLRRKILDRSALWKETLIPTKSKLCRHSFRRDSPSQEKPQKNVEYPHVHL